MDELEQVKREDQLVADALRAAGTQVVSTQDLVNTNDQYTNAIPVLLEMLPKVSTYAMKKIIVRSLGVREAKGKAESLLIALFETSLSDRSRDAETLRWIIANTFDILGGGRGVSESLLRLLADPRSGGSRQMLSLAVAKTKNRDAIPVLLDLINNDEFTGHVAEALGILRAAEATPKLKEIAGSHKKPWVRRQAKTALRRLGEAE